MHPRARRNLRWLTLLSVGALLAALLAAPTASLAHERRTIAGGKYDIVVGWDSEPAFVSQRNAAGIRISKAGTNPAQPVTGAEQTLKVQIRQGSQTRSFDLRAVFGQPGYYLADIVPTRAGDYVWTFTGSIGADTVNETFDSADGKFDAVGSGSAIQFPIAAPDPDQVTAQLQAADAAVQRTQLLAYLGIGLAALACLLGLVVWLTRPRERDAILMNGRDVSGPRSGVSVRR